jgi:serine/threonine-protein kinase
MPLSRGGQRGRYEIVARIGAGGMDEAYRARDGKLNRDVAIEVLPAALAPDTTICSFGRATNRHRGWFV